FANVRMRSTLSPAQRTSVCGLRSPLQPSFASSPSNKESQLLALASVSLNAISTPIRRTRTICCACAETGQTVAALPRTLMKSRHLLADTELLSLSGILLSLGSADV